MEKIVYKGTDWDWEVRQWNRYYCDGDVVAEIKVWSARRFGWRVFRWEQAPGNAKKILVAEGTERGLEAAQKAADLAAYSVREA